MINLEGEHRRLGAQLRHLREHAHLSPEQLATRLEEPVGFVTAYENGVYHLDILQLRTIATAIDTPNAAVIVTALHTFDTILIALAHDPDPS